MQNELVYHAAVQQSFRLGCIKPKAPKQALRLACYLDSYAETHPPETVDYATKAQTALARMLLNDRYGCCVMSGAFHELGVWTGNDSDSGGLVMPTDAEVQQQYFKLTGGHDNGLVITDVLDFQKAHGLIAAGKTYQIDGYVAIDPTNPIELRVALYLFGAIKFGTDWYTSDANNEANGAVIGRQRGRDLGGHDVEGCGYDGTGVKISSHGMVYTMTWDRIAQMSEAYAPLSPNWYGNDKLAPCGIDVTALRDDLAKLAGGQIPDITPTPPAPQPTPTPVPPAPTPGGPFTVTLQSDSPITFVTKN